MPSPVDLSTRVGTVGLVSPVMNASGIAGHGTELSDQVDLSGLGAFVAKSLCVEPWPGNPAPRVHMTPAGMINGVGLQGPGVGAWLRDDLLALEARGVERVVASIWGRTTEEFHAAATALVDAPALVVAVEVNLSCPNTEAGRGLFAHDAEMAATVVGACASVLDRPVWAKLSPNTDRLIDVAAAVYERGAEAVTLVNTLLGMVIDVETRRPVLSNGGGGVSGSAIHPMAVRAVHDVHAALGDVPIVGVGGISNGVDAIEFLLAGASAVQVGTAAFANPRVLRSIASEMEEWCRRHDVGSIRELIGGAHEPK